MTQIKKNLTTVNYNSGRGGSTIKWIVIHNTANASSAEGTAKNNTIYFKGVYREASAHYFVDDGPVIWQCVDDSDTAWHCGDTNNGPIQWAGKEGCGNRNSIGIEVCEPKGGKFTQAEKDNLRWLVQKLMAEYNVPAKRVVRHYDVHGKDCPWYYVKHLDAWKELRTYITEPAHKGTKYVTQYAVNIRSTHNFASKYINRKVPKGTAVWVVETWTAESGNVWGKLDTGEWMILSEKVTKHYAKESK